MPPLPSSGLAPPRSWPQPNRAGHPWGGGGDAGRLRQEDSGEQYFCWHYGKYWHFGGAEACWTSYVEPFFHTLGSRHWVILPAKPNVACCRLFRLHLTSQSAPPSSSLPFISVIKGRRACSLVVCKAMKFSHQSYYMALPQFWVYLPIKLWQFETLESYKFCDMKATKSLV